MKKIYMGIVSITILLFITGCSSSSNNLSNVFQKNYSVALPIIYTDGLKDIVLEDIYVIDFNRDIVDLADNIAIGLNSIYVNNDKFFKSQRREDLTLIHNYVKSSSKRNIITENKYIISGEVKLADFTTDEVINSRIDYESCLKYNSETNECEIYPEIDEICTDYKYVLASTVMIRNLGDSKIIYDKYFESKKSVRNCNRLGNAKELPILSTNLDLLSKDIAKKFIDDILPKKSMVNAFFLLNEDIYYSEEEKNLLNNGVKAFYENHLKAIDIFKNLVDSTNEYSSVALYNLALVYESIKDYEHAEKYYKKAFDIAALQDEINESIVNAIKRVSRNKKFKGIL